VGFGLLVIGSELLTGKRRDGHLPHAIEALGRRGLDLDWCTFLTDDPERITAVLRATMASGDVVFSFGGIGATPDDHTRRCAARAAGVPVARHPEAAAIIDARFGETAYPQRVRMADLPLGAKLIPNPVNRIAGFSLGDHHFVPGFPQMAWPMMDWVLDHYYRDRFADVPPAQVLLTVPGTSEGQLIGIMEPFVERFPDIQFSCLPHMDGDYRETELGVRGPEQAVDEAAAWLEQRLAGAGFEWRRR